MSQHDPFQIAQLAASLLQSRELDVGRHHARSAVAAARMILDEAHLPAEPQASEAPDVAQFSITN
jgi:hypothetical protein